MKTLNTKRAAMLKTDKIAVLNEWGTAEELREIFSHILDPHKFNGILGGNDFYYISGYDWDGHSGNLPDGYTSHPISWFYESDEVKPVEATQPEAEIIGWELLIDVPELGQKASKTTKIFPKQKAGVWYFTECSIPESILRDMKSARPIYKRSISDILDDLILGNISKDEAVKELEQTKS